MNNPLQSRKASQKPASRKGARSGESQAASHALESLYGRPAFLLRRAHQIATSLFVESCAELELTPTQFLSLFALRHRSAIGQNELARLIGMDRSTASVTVRVLKSRELVQALEDPGDRRRVALVLTDKGRLTLARAERLNSRVSAELMSVFSAKEAETFLELLDRVVKAFNAKARTPLSPDH